MNNKGNIWIVLLGAAVGFAIGWGFRQWNKAPQDRADHPAVRSEPSVPMAKTAANRTHNAPEVGSALVSKLERDLSMAKGVTRWLFWFEALENARPEDFARLAELARSDSAILKMVAARWMEVNPQSMFESAAALLQESSSRELGSSLMNLLLDSWPKTDPEAAIAAVGAARSRLGRNWEIRVINAIFDKNIERGLKLLHEWSVHDYGPSVKAVRPWVEANPQHAAQFTLQHMAGYGSTLVLEEVGTIWGEMDPHAALAFASNHPGEVGAMLARTAMQSWASKNLNAAAQWLVEAPAAVRNQVSASFVEVWAKQDASGALQWTESNLSGPARQRAVEGVMKGAAKKNVQEAARLVNSMKDPWLKGESAAVVLERWLPEGWGSSAKIQAETYQWLASLEPSVRNRALEKEAWTWTRHDPEGAAQFLLKHGQGISENVYSITARNFAEKNPAEAVKWAEQFWAEVGPAPQVSAFYTWYSHQPENALRWFDNLPATHPNHTALFQAAVSSLVNAPGTPQALAQWPEPRRQAARRLVEKMELPPERKALVTSLLK
jgi:hypothetical protein